MPGNPARSRTPDHVNPHEGVKTIKPMAENTFAYSTALQYQRNDNVIILTCNLIQKTK
jgi:hypothetical protein